MLIFLYGPDTYRSKQRLNELIDEHKKSQPSGLSLKYLDGQNLKIEELLDETKQVSMFGERKMIILRNVSANPDFKEKFQKQAPQLIDSGDVVVIFEESSPKKEKFFSFLKAKAKSEEFAFLEGEDLKRWCKNEFTNLGAKVSPSVLESLLEYAGNDTWRIQNEIKKLVSFKSGGVIEPADIKLLVKPTVETDIFRTIDELAKKNRKEAIRLVHKHLGKGDAPPYLLSMINFQFRNLLVVKDLMEKNRPYYAILKTAGMHPFLVKKSYEQAQKFSLVELKKIYQKIFEVDLGIKTGKIEPETALDLLISRI